MVILWNDKYWGQKGDITTLKIGTVWHSAYFDRITQHFWGGWSVPLRDVTHKGVHQMITKMLYFTNISRMGDYSDEIDEYEWLTAEDDHKNECLQWASGNRGLEKNAKIWKNMKWQHKKSMK